VLPSSSIEHDDGTREVNSRAGQNGDKIAFQPRRSKSGQISFGENFSAAQQVFPGVSSHEASEER
jgi:hypothetical protein